jgi:hypothetical protein
MSNTKGRMKGSLVIQCTLDGHLIDGSDCQLSGRNNGERSVGQISGNPSQEKLPYSPVSNLVMLTCFLVTGAAAALAHC